jgi:hypothetical protein
MNRELRRKHPVDIKAIHLFENNTMVKTLLSLRGKLWESWLKKEIAE